MSSNIRHNWRKEKESNLHVFRLDKGLSIKELCEKAKICDTDYHALQNGSRSPLYLTGINQGRIKESASRLLNVLGCSVEEVFPRYVCSLKDDIYTDEQINEVMVGMETLKEINIEEQYDREEFIKSFLPVLTKNMSKNEIKTLFLRIIHGETLDEVGAEMGYSRERIRQFESKIYNKIRYWRGVLKLQEN